MPSNTQLLTIEVIHKHSKERKTLDVQAVFKDEIIVFWPLSGAYRLFLATNTMRAVSRSAQIKYKNIVPWEAVDIAALREAVRIHLDGEDRKKLTERLARGRPPSRLERDLKGKK